MLARLRKATEEKDQGFTLIELLVVMIIIGILAAIAIPVFLNQRKAARDSSTKADVSTIGKEIAAYFVDGTGTLTLAEGTGNNAGKFVLSDGAGFTTAITYSKGTVLPTPAAAASSNLGSSTNWCVALTNPDGAKQSWKYTAQGGLVSGTCATTP